MIKDFTQEQLSAFREYTRITVTTYAREQLFYNELSRQNDIKFQNFQEILEQKQEMNQSVSRPAEEWITRNESMNIWENLSKKYDVNYGTFEDIVSIANSLYKSGEITLKEVAIMTFDFENDTHTLKQDTNSLSSRFNMYETDTDENGKRNWIAEFGARAKKNFKIGNLLGYNSNMEILGILQRLVRE